MAVTHEKLALAINYLKSNEFTEADGETAVNLLGTYRGYGIGTTEADTGPMTVEIQLDGVWYGSYHADDIDWEFDEKQVLADAKKHIRKIIEIIGEEYE